MLSTYRLIGPFSLFHLDHLGLELYDNTTN